MQTGHLHLPLIQDIITRTARGHYFFNKTFYRVSKLRIEIKPELQTGHFHIAKLQSPGFYLNTGDDFNNNDMQTAFDIIKTTITNGIKGLKDE